MISTYLLCLVVGCDRVGSVMVVAVAFMSFSLPSLVSVKASFFCFILLLLRWWSDLVTRPFILIICCVLHRLSRIGKGDECFAPFSFYVRSARILSLSFSLFLLVLGFARNTLFHLVR